MTPEKVMQELCKVIRPGDIVNFDSKPKWYQFWLKFVFAEIRRCQRKKFGKKSRWGDIHSVLVLWNEPDELPMVLSATVPVAVTESLSISKRTRKVTVCRLRGAEDGFSDKWLKNMRSSALELVGRGYDPFDLFAIKLKLQGWRRNKLGRWLTGCLDLGKKRVVCSGAVQYCLLEAWDELSKTHSLFELPVYPLDGLAPNEAMPASFPNHESFEIVKEVKLSCQKQS